MIRDERHYLATVRDVRALAERIEHVEGAKDLADKARTMQVWAERAKLGTEQVNLAAAARLWAERRAGELLAAMPKQNGSRGFGKSPNDVESHDVTPLPPTLADLGVSKQESSRWQQLAEIPPDAFEQAVEQASEQGIVSAARVTAIAEGKFERRVKDEFFPARTPVFDAF